MSMRNSNWIRRRTNVHDLLDDGMENSSDLESFKRGSEPPVPADPHAQTVRSDTLARVESEFAAQQRAVRKKNISALGIFLGLLIAVSGSLLIAFPVDMPVEHRRIMYLPTVVEYVSSARSRLYGVAGLVVGLAILAYSLHRPRS